MTEPVKSADLKEALSNYLTKMADYYGNGEHEPLVLDVEMSVNETRWMSVVDEGHITHKSAPDEAFGILGAVQADYPWRDGPGGEKVLVISTLETEDFEGTDLDPLDGDTQVSHYFAFSREEAKRVAQAINKIWPDILPAYRIIR